MAQANVLFLITLCVIHFVTVSATRRTKRASTTPCLIKPEDERFREVLERELDGNTKIIEYELHFKNIPSEFWDVMSNGHWFKPTRWYYTNTEGAERLLLLFHYYYGLLRPLVQVGVSAMDVALVVEPAGCLQTLSRDQIQNLLYNLVLTKFHLTQNWTGLPQTDNKHACTMHIVDNDGWGKLAYNCCMRMEDGNTRCEIVADNIWVWVLRAFIISITIVLFLFSPMFIPTSYKTSVFSYYPPGGLVFNVLKTRTPPTDCTEAQVVSMKNITMLPGLHKELKTIPDNTIFHIKVSKMKFSVCYDRLLGENEEPVGMLKLLFNALLRCKIRHSDPLEKCCNTSVFGECSRGCGPRWYRFLQVVRTIVVFSVFALPAVPLFYSLCDDQLAYRQATRHITYLHLKQSYNFDVGVVWGKVIVAILSVTYLIHVLVVVLDGVMDQSLGKLYNDLIEASSADVAISERIQSFGRLVKYICLPIQKFGFCAIPLFAISPLVLCLYIIFTTPTLKMVYHVFSLVTNWIQRRQTDNGLVSESRADIAEQIIFTVTLISVFVILSIGVDFFLQVVALLVVNMSMNLHLTMKILPLAFLVLFYIRNTFNGVSTMFTSYHNTILKQVQAIKSDALKIEAKQDISQQERKIFHIISPDEADATKKVEVTKKHGKFKFKHDCLRMKTKSLILFLDNDDTPYVSKKFFYHTVDIECPGVPGYLEEAVLRAFFEFVKIALFLAFILFVVMAYGDAHVSPTGQFIATFCSGMVPFILRKILKVTGPQSLDTSSLRFQTHLAQRLESFKQAWSIDDIVVDSVSEAVFEPQKFYYGRKSVASKWNMSIDSKNELDVSSVDLLVYTNPVSESDDCCVACGCFSGSVRDMSYVP